MQEAIVAKDLLIMCGTHTLKWERIKITGENLSWRTAGDDGPEQFHHFHPSQRSLDDETHTLINSFREKWAAGKFDVSVFRLLYEFRRLQCGNPRDRIYAFLGVAGIGSETGFKANYKTTVKEAYIDFATFMIKHKQSTDILNCMRE
jgi:hypothetical protein